jgi:hypothetical protein
MTSKDDIRVKAHKAVDNARVAVNEVVDDAKTAVFTMSQRAKVQMCTTPWLRKWSMIKRSKPMKSVQMRKSERTGKQKKQRRSSRALSEYITGILPRFRR